MSTIKIWGTSFSLIGDLIMSLPQLNYFKKKYPDSYIYFVIHKKIAYSAPLFFNHPLIDKIHISEKWSEFGQNDYEIAKDCHVSTAVIDKNAKSILKRVPSNQWYNKRNCIYENALMSGINDLNKILTEDELYPKLYQWFDVGFDSTQKKGGYTFKKKESSENKNLSDYISIWPFAAYGRSETRSPSEKWWIDAVNQIIKKGHKVLHCGYFTEPNLSDDNNNYKKITELSFFDQIKISLATKLSIGTDSGSMWVLGAYNHPAIHLMTNWSENHKSNFSAFEPVNNHSITLFEQGGCDNIKIENMISSLSGFKDNDSFITKIYKKLI